MLRADLIRSIRTASSFHITGRLTHGGERIGLDLGLLRTGQASGWVSTQGTKLRIIVTAEAAYLQVSPGYLRLAHAPSAVCAAVCGAGNAAARCASFTE